MVELAVGLVAMMVLLGALIQIGRLAHARTRTMMEARAAAGALGLGAGNAFWPFGSEYIYNWHAGRDGRAYTRDDVRIIAVGAVSSVQAAVEASGMAGVPEPPVNPFHSLSAGVNPAQDFALVHGSESESVDVLPVVRRLVYNQESIVVTSSTCLVWMEGIY